MNFTVLAPKGSINHNDPHLICSPPTVKDLFLLYTLNYFIHAASLPTMPGETKREIFFAIINALFVPGYGASRALRRLIVRPAFTRGSYLNRAAAAGVLCMVVSSDTVGEFSKASEGRSTWLSQTFRYPGRLAGALVPAKRAVHGICDVPISYTLVLLPHGVKLRRFSRKGSSLRALESLGLQPEQHGAGNVQPLLPTPPQDGSDNEPDMKAFKPCSIHNIPKIMFSLVQVVTGIITIYRARGDQLERYGVAAFGLTVVPYVFMSFVNIVASILSPEYPTMYLVYSPDMDLAEEAGGVFDSVVAELDISGTAGPKSSGGSGRPYLSWIITGSISGLFGALVGGSMKNELSKDDGPRAVKTGIYIGAMILMAPIWIPVIGGMVMVSKQLAEYGICLRVDS